ncbi:MAG: polysaccharide pyruvyl transferase family protein [Pseudomonadota bacterium]
MAIGGPVGLAICPLSKSAYGLGRGEAVTRFVVFGLPYSPNLGDGVIADCLEYALRKTVPEADVQAVDLSGRMKRGQVVVGNRSLKLRLLEMMPQALKQRAVEYYLGRIVDAAKPSWRRTLEDADMAFIGGGQLFSDADLNFCVKIAGACEVLEDAKVPVAVHAVGVARNWSQRGTALFSKVKLTKLSWIGLRDMYSLEAWNDQMPADGPGRSLPETTVVRDPGLLAEGAYGRGKATGGIGLCVTAPMILGYHSDVSAHKAPILEFFADCAKGLSEQGHPVTLFCNGADEDQFAISKLSDDPSVQPLISQGKVVVAPTPKQPRELAHLISGFDLVVAHRLHACILAYAYGIPSVGLGWDQKVESFFASVDRQDFFLNPASLRPEEVVKKVQAAAGSPIGAEDKERVLKETQAGVDNAARSALGLH